MNMNPCTNDRERRYDQAIAKQYAPLILQDMDRAPLHDLQQDFITRVNYDGDWKSGNNWDNFDDYRDSLYAYVYYYLVETETHYFIIYSIFHPRDWLNSSHCNSIPGNTDPRPSPI